MNKSTLRATITEDVYRLVAKKKDITTEEAFRALRNRYRKLSNVALEELLDDFVATVINAAFRALRQVVLNQQVLPLPIPYFIAVDTTTARSVVTEFARKVEWHAHVEIERRNRDGVVQSFANTEAETEIFDSYWASDESLTVGEILAKLGEKR